MLKIKENDQTLARQKAYEQLEHILKVCKLNNISLKEKDIIAAKAEILFYELRYKNYSEVEKLLIYYQSIKSPTLKDESDAICFRALAQAVTQHDTVGMLLFFNYGYKNLARSFRTDNGIEEKSILYHALEIGNTNVIELILNDSVNVKTLKHKNAFALLGKLGHKTIIEDLKEQWTDADPPLKECLEQALQSAAQYGQLALVEFLCTQDIDIHALGEDKHNALILASRYGKKSVVEKLLNYTCTAENIACAFVHAAVYAIEKIKSAVANDNEDLYESMGVLFKHGADINSVDQNGDTIFIKAADCPEFLTKILETKKFKSLINIDYENEKTGETALITAAKKGNLAAVNVLRTNGADCNKVSSQGKTLIMTAIEHAPFHFVKALMELPITYNPGVILSSAVFLGKLEIVQLLLNMHTYNTSQLWCCVVALGHVQVCGKNIELSEKLALQMLLILTRTEDFDPNDIQVQLPQTIQSAVNNQQMLLLSKLLDLQQGPNKLYLNSFILTALSERKFTLAYALIDLMVERAEPTYHHLKGWQTMMQVHNSFSPPTLTSTVMARIYLRKLLNMTAENLTDGFIKAADPYEELIVNELLSNGDEQTIKSSIAINGGHYANGLSKFLHTLNSEPATLIEDNISRIQGRIVEIESIMIQSSALIILRTANNKDELLSKLRGLQNGSQNSELNFFAAIALQNNLLQSFTWLLDEMVKTAEPTYLHMQEWLEINQFPATKFSARAMAMRYFDYLNTLSAEEVTPKLMQAAEPYRTLIVAIALETPEADVLEEFIRKDEKGYAHGFSKFLHINATSSTIWPATSPWLTSAEESIKLIKEGVRTRREADKTLLMVEFLKK